MMALVLRGLRRPCIVTDRIMCVTSIQFRWRKIPHRKPRWLPTAPSKVFLISVHPYVSPEEQKLRLELVDEYFSKIESIRKLFKDELEKRSAESAIALELAKVEEEEHKRLMEENRKENERVRIIREETLEKEFEENALNLLKMYEEKQALEQQKKEHIEQQILREKASSKTYVTYENLDKVVEIAMDNPINIGFCINTKGQITWEGTPPKEYEEYVYDCLKSSVVELVQPGSPQET